ncbi:MAG: RNA-binding S4 domain-containing protein [Bacteroidales bacterium]|nr:RNA-binding S4 domain-containing protein [Candidatus Cryptobacteroides equifaecalis]
MENVRIDKYLWAIRAFKTRSEAADACNGNKVKLNGTNAKASKPVKEGDMIEVHKGPVNYSYRVIKLTESRMGTALVPDFAENLTPESELNKLHAPVETIMLKRDKGTGRPTKKERRSLDALFDELD